MSWGTAAKVHGDSRFCTLACAILFRRTAADVTYNPPMPSLGQQIWKAYKLLHWVMLVALVLVVAIALRRPVPVTLPPDPADIKENAKSLEQKLQRLETQHQNGEPNAEVRLDGDEVNSFIAENVRSLPSSAVEESGAPAIKPATVAFAGDEVIAQTSVHRYGQDIVVTVRGRLGSRDGYLTFAPTGFKIGDLSIPVSLVDSQLQQKLDEPENREKLKLPAFVGDLRVENGQLVIAEK